MEVTRFAKVESGRCVWGLDLRRGEASSTPLPASHDATALLNGVNSASTEKVGVFAHAIAVQCPNDWWGRNLLPDQRFNQTLMTGQVVH